MSQKTSVTRSDKMETFRLRGGPGGYEWATICLQGWNSLGFDQKPMERGEILIHSSYGSWAYQWGNLGVPFKRFLLNVERDYLAGKFLGVLADEFDGDKSVLEIRRKVIDQRKTDSLGKDAARWIWDHIDTYEGEMKFSADRFCQVMFGVPEHYKDETGDQLPRAMQALCAEPYEWISTRMPPSFANFWRDLWPLLVAELRTELARPIGPTEELAAL